jgi:hypothetical protein
VEPIDVRNTRFFKLLIRQLKQPVLRSLFSSQPMNLTKEDQEGKSEAIANETPRDWYIDNQVTR